MHDHPNTRIRRVIIKGDALPWGWSFRREWLDRLIEHQVFGKVEDHGYGNYIKANLRVFAAFRVTYLAFSLVFLLTVGTLFSVTPTIEMLPIKELGAYFLSIPVTFVLTVSGVFWKEKKSLHDKWSYLAGLYNQLIETPHTDGEDEYPKREILEAALAQDILLMEMWAHDSYAEVFYRCLTKAILDYSVPKSSGEFMVGHLESTGITRSLAMTYLSAYQDKLTSKGKTPGPTPSLRAQTPLRRKSS